MRLKLKKILFLALTFCLLVPMSAYAATPSFYVKASASSVSPNGTFTVTVGGQSVGRVNISVKNGTASPSSLWLENNETKITVKAGGSGTVTVTATPAEGMSDLDGNLYSPGSKNVSVTIKAPNQSTPTTPKPTTPTPTTPVVPEVNPMDKAVEVTIGEAKWYLWPELINVTLPAGFEKGESKYKESPIQVGQRQQVLLAYLTDGEGKNGTFWTFNAQTQEFYPYVALQSSGSYVLLQPGADVALPEGYETTTTFELDGRTVNGWKSEDEAIQDYVLVYAMNSEGKEGFYYYDIQEKTMQRFGQRIVEVEVIVEPEPEPIIRQIFGNPILAGIFSGLGLLAAGLAAGLIRTIQKYKSR